MKILAVVGTDRFVEEDVQTDRGWVKTGILKNDPTGIAILHILKGNGDRRRIAIEKRRTVLVRECDTAEHIANIYHSGYRPNLVVIALNTRIQTTAEDVERLELERFGCQTIVIVSPDQRHPVAESCLVITWDNDISASNRLKTVVNRVADAVNTREQHERRVQWEQEKKADAAVADRVAKMTEEEWSAKKLEKEKKNKP